MSSAGQTPFCSQPWSTLYVQWDGKLTRPCIRGPQNLGSVPDTVFPSLWNGASLEAVRTQVRDGKNMNNVCGSCFKDRTRVIDHLGPFADNIDGFEIDKVENYYNALRNWEDGESKVSSTPTVLVLDMSSKCNVRCPKCFIYNSNMQYALGHMSMETFDKIVPLLKNALLVIGHENGESILNKNFFEMVQIIKANGCRFTFNTTGQTLTEDKSRALVELGVEQIMFSIDSIESKLYETMHKGGKLDRLMGNLEALHRAKQTQGRHTPELGWYFVACRSNLAEMEAVVRRAAELGFSSIYMSQLNRPTPEQWRSYFDYYRAETMFGTEADTAAFRQARDGARSLAAQLGIKFSAGFMG